MSLSLGVLLFSLPAVFVPLGLYAYYYQPLLVVLLALFAHYWGRHIEIET